MEKTQDIAQESIDINTALKDLQQYKRLYQRLISQLKEMREDINKLRCENLILVQKLATIKQTITSLPKRYHDLQIKLLQKQNSDYKINLTNVKIKQLTEKFRKNVTDNKQTSPSDDEKSVTHLQEIQQSLLKLIAENKNKLDQKINNVEK